MKALSESDVSEADEETQHMKQLLSNHYIADWLASTLGTVAKTDISFEQLLKEIAPGHVIEENDIKNLKEKILSPYISFFFFLNA